MWILILVIINNNNISSTTAKFTEQMNCLKAIEKTLEMETNTLKIKARCVRE
jgi:hypothetical protein